jgi:hypothetical protein
MKNVWIWLSTLCSLLFLFGGCEQNRDMNTQQNDNQRKFVSPDTLIPVPKSSAERRVAILNLRVISGDKGEVKSVELQRGRVINSFAPNVLNVSGQWMVELVGQQVYSFGCSDPRRVEAENDEFKKPFIYVFEKVIEWELVAPLNNAAGKDLQVKRVNIYDQERNLIFAASVDQDKVSQIENPANDG